MCQCSAVANEEHERRGGAGAREPADSERGYAAGARQRFMLLCGVLSIFHGAILAYKVLTDDVSDLGFQQASLSLALGGFSAMATWIVVHRSAARNLAWLLSLLALVGVILAVWALVGALER